MEKESKISKMKKNTLPVCCINVIKLFFIYFHLNSYIYIQPLDFYKIFKDEVTTTSVVKKSCEKISKPKKSSGNIKNKNSTVKKFRKEKKITDIFNNVIEYPVKKNIDTSVNFANNALQNDISLIKNKINKRNLKKSDILSYKDCLPQKSKIEKSRIKDYSEINKNYGKSLDRNIPICKKNKTSRDISSLSGKKINPSEHPKKKYSDSTKKLVVIREKIKKTKTDNLEKSAKLRKTKKNYETMEILTSKEKEILPNKSSSKVDNAINKFKINFQATMIQKIFRGYIFRKYNRYIINRKKNNTIKNKNYNKVNLNPNLFPSLYVKKKSGQTKNVLTISNTNNQNTNFGAAPPKISSSSNTNQNLEKDINNNFIQEIVIKKNKMADVLVAISSRNRKIQEKTISMNGSGLINKSLKLSSRGDKFLMFKYLCIWKDRVYRYIILEKIFEYFKGYDFNIKKGYMCLNGKRDYTNMGLGFCLDGDTDLYSSNTFNVENLNATFNNRYSNFQY